MAFAMAETLLPLALRRLLSIFVALFWGATLVSAQKFDINPRDHLCSRWYSQSVVKNNVLFVDGGVQKFGDRWDDPRAYLGISTLQSVTLVMVSNVCRQLVSKPGVQLMCYLGGGSRHLQYDRLIAFHVPTLGFSNVLILDCDLQPHHYPPKLHMGLEEPGPNCQHHGQCRAEKRDKSKNGNAPSIFDTRPPVSWAYQYFGNLEFWRNHIYGQSVF